ncbi:hypothetical protein M8C21_012188, partial [Ambrosia artemisiifolia]
KIDKISLCKAKLRLFLTKKNGFKVLNLYISAIRTQKFTDIEKVKAIELPPYELEHVELQLDTLEESSAHIAFVDAVLWCCHPLSLTLRSSVPFEEHGDLVKFTYKKLLEQEDHTSIQIVGPSSSEAQKQLRDLKSLSVGLSRDGNAISFIKEEVVQEEALSQRSLVMLSVKTKFTYKKLLEQEDHTSIQIVGPSSSEAQKQLRDLKSLSVGLPRDGKAISFIKERVVQEEALGQRFADMEIF